MRLNSLTPSRLHSNLHVEKDSPADEKPQADSQALTITDGVKIAGAATAGGVTGLTRGLFKGSSALAKQPAEGARFGAKVLRPLGRLIGGTAAVVATGATALAAPVATVLGAGAGMVVGTAAGAAPLVKHGLSAGARAGVRAGAVVGSAVLGAVGGVVGAAAGLLTLPTLLYPPLGIRVVPLAVRAGAVGGFRAGVVGGRYAGMGVGAAVGATLGGATAIVAGTPQGLRTGVAAARQSGRIFAAVPKVARGAWSAGMKGGDLAGNVVGGAIGGAVGIGTGLVTTVANGAVDGTRTAIRWGGYALGPSEDKNSQKAQSAET